MFYLLFVSSFVVHLYLLLNIEDFMCTVGKCHSLLCDFLMPVIIFLLFCPVQFGTVVMVVVRLCGSRSPMAVWEVWLLRWV